MEKYSNHKQPYVRHISQISYQSICSVANNKRKKKEIHAKITPGTIQHSPGHYTAAACRPETKIRGNDASSVQAKKVKHDRSSASMVCRGDSVDREGNSRCGSAPGLGGDEISRRLLQSRLLWASVRSLSALQSGDLSEGAERKRSPRFRCIQQTRVAS